ncbi:MAG: lipid-A-disaccharide synthase [Rhodobacteraceae bacterium]|nr:lipid-A-disaccharide synthase [Paracoccaceae bacterium]
MQVFLVAAEPSGDRLGAALMRGLMAETEGAVRFSGIGGSAMAAEGLESLFPIEGIAVMGIAEVLPRLRTLLRKMRETAPGFGLRVSERARPKAGPHTAFVHYVAPSVWAWRPKRAEMMAKHTDHLLALLPFEPPYFQRVGLSCDFVGHPVLEAVAEVDPADRRFRAEIGVAPEAPLLIALPGSRAGEVRRLAPLFGQALAALTQRRPGLRVIVPAAENVVDLVRAETASWPSPPVILDPRDLSFREAEQRKLRAMAAADAALAASGTVSLELAAMRTPMAIAYRTNALTAAIVRRLIKIDTATLVNLVSETRHVPEFLQENFKPAEVAAALDALLDPASELRVLQAEASAETMRRLGEGDVAPSRRAAKSVLSAIARKRAALAG